MKEFSIVMSLVDFIPVIFFAVGAIILQRDLYPKMSKGAFALFAAGTIDVICAGALKALYKLLYAANVCDFDALNKLFFPLQSIGFLLAGIGVVACLTHRQSEKESNLAAVAAPAAFSGTMIFVTLMVLGLGMMDAGLCVIAAKRKKAGIIALLVVSFICCLGMGYLSTKTFDKAFMNWVAEGVNVVGQLFYMLAAIAISKAKKNA